VSGGRYVPVDPVRVLDTRPDTSGPVPTGWTPHKPGARSTVPVTGLPTGAAAVVVNVTATQADRAGFVRSQPGGASAGAPLDTANGNYERGVSSGTLSVVPVAPDGSIEIFTSAPTHIVVDLLGWFTGATATPSREGLFVPLTPTRAYDSRFPSRIHGRDTTRTLALSSASGAIPVGAVSISMNVAADAAEGEGFLTISPAGAPRPLVSNLNYPTAAPISNAALPRLGIGGAVDAYVNRATHVIIDVNGYFTGSG
jgi:hypothetical protein